MAFTPKHHKILESILPLTRRIALRVQDGSLEPEVLLAEIALVNESVEFLVEATRPSSDVSPTTRPHDLSP